MDVILICSLAVSSVMVSKLLEQGNKDMKSLITLSIVVMLSMRALAALSGVIRTIESFMQEIEFSQEYAKIMLKSLGICLVSRLCTDCCKDLNENAVASQIELVCRASLIIVSLPLYKAVIEIVIALIGN